MKIKKIIEDSKNIQGDRITTFVLTFPRFLLAELNTHRMFSRNSASSRAIPFEKMVKSVKENPFIPIAWQKDHKGMQGTEYITNEIAIKNLNNQWLRARNEAIKSAESLNKGAYTVEVAKDENGNNTREFTCIDIPDTSVTKQLCNRLLEHFMWHTVILTATDFDNFFDLRCPKYFGKFKSWKDTCNQSSGDINASILDRLIWNEGQSEIHMMALAEAMYDEMNESVPKLLKAGEYHIPFEEKIKEQIKTQLYKVNTHLSPNGNYIVDYNEKDVLKISVAQAARVSYTTVGEDNKEFNYENDIKLHDKLLQSGHWSPFEHCAKAMSEEEYHSFYKGGNLYFYDNFSGFSGSKLIGKTIESSLEVDNKNSGYCNNFKGFIQYRYLIDNKDE